MHIIYLKHSYVMIVLITIIISVFIIIEVG